jgi:hypothetical protein
MSRHVDLKELTKGYSLSRQYAFCTIKTYTFAETPSRTK